MLSQHLSILLPKQTSCWKNGSTFNCAFVCRISSQCILLPRCLCLSRVILNFEIKEISSFSQFHCWGTGLFWGPRIAPLDIKSKSPDWYISWTRKECFPLRARGEKWGRGEKSWTWSHHRYHWEARHSLLWLQLETHHVEDSLGRRWGDWSEQEVPCKPGPAQPLPLCCMVYDLGMVFTDEHCAADLRMKKANFENQLSEMWLPPKRIPFLSLVGLYYDNKARKSVLNYYYHILNFINEKYVEILSHS